MSSSQLNIDATPFVFRPSATPFVPKFTPAPFPTPTFIPSNEDTTLLPIFDDLIPQHDDDSKCFSMQLLFSLVHTPLFSDVKLPKIPSYLTYDTPEYFDFCNTNVVKPPKRDHKNTNNWSDNSLFMSPAKSEPRKKQMSKSSLQQESLELKKKRQLRYAKYDEEDAGVKNDSNDVFIGFGSTEDMIRILDNSSKGHPNNKRNRGKRLPATHSKPSSSVHVLVPTENRWVPNRQKSQVDTLDSEDKEQIILIKSLISLMNKLTEENFDVVSLKLLLAISKITTLSSLRQIVRVIFEKAVGEQKFSGMYARLCILLNEGFDPSKSKKNTIKKKGLKRPPSIITEPTFVPTIENETFMTCMLNECYKQLANEETSTLPSGFPKAFLVRPDDLPDDKSDKKRKRVRGTIIFMGELFKRGFISWHIVYLCLSMLMDNDVFGDRCETAMNDDDAENLHVLLMSVGKSFDKLLKDSSLSISTPTPITPILNFAPLSPMSPGSNILLTPPPTKSNFSRVCPNTAPSNSSIFSRGSFDSLQVEHCDLTDNNLDDFDHTDYKLSTINMFQDGNSFDIIESDFDEHDIEPIPLPPLTSALSITVNYLDSNQSPNLVAKVDPGSAVDTVFVSHSPLLRAWTRKLETNKSAFNADSPSMLSNSPLLDGHMCALTLDEQPLIIPATPAKSIVSVAQTRDYVHRNIPSNLADLKILLDKYYDMIADFIKPDSGLSNRPRYLLLDLLELRENNWVPPDQAVLRKRNKNSTILKKESFTPSKPAVSSSSSYNPSSRFKTDLVETVSIQSPIVVDNTSFELCTSNSFVDDSISDSEDEDMYAFNAIEPDEFVRSYSIDSLVENLLKTHNVNEAVLDLIDIYKKNPYMMEINVSFLRSQWIRFQLQQLVYVSVYSVVNSSSPFITSLMNFLDIISSDAFIDECKRALVTDNKEDDYEDYSHWALTSDDIQFAMRCFCAQLSDLKLDIPNVYDLTADILIAMASVDGKRPPLLCIFDAFQSFISYTPDIAKVEYDKYMIRFNQAVSSIQDLSMPFEEIVSTIYEAIIGKKDSFIAGYHTSIRVVDGAISCSSFEESFTKDAVDSFYIVMSKVVRFLIVDESSDVCLRLKTPHISTSIANLKSISKATDIKGLIRYLLPKQTSKNIVATIVSGIGADVVEKYNMV